MRVGYAAFGFALLVYFCLGFAVSRSPEKNPHQSCCISEKDFLSAHLSDREKWEIVWNAEVGIPDAIGEAFSRHQKEFERECPNSPAFRTCTDELGNQIKKIVQTEYEGGDEQLLAFYELSAFCSSSR